MLEFHDTPRDTKILIAKQATTKANKKASQTTTIYIYIYIYIYIASTINTQTDYHEHSVPSLLLEGCETTIVGIP